MRRKRKENLTPLPEVKIEYVTASFICPTCNRRLTKDLVYIPPGSTSVLATARATTGYWCKCSASHQITYKIRKTRKGEIRLKIFKFLSNGEEFNKRFKVL